MSERERFQFFQLRYENAQEKFFIQVQNIYALLEKNGKLKIKNSLKNYKKNCFSLDIEFI
jgi:hypothetical protein